MAMACVHLFCNLIDTVQSVRKLFTKARQLRENRSEIFPIHESDIEGMDIKHHAIFLMKPLVEDRRFIHNLCEIDFLELRAHRTHDSGKVRPFFHIDDTRFFCPVNGETGFPHIRLRSELSGFQENEFALGEIDMENLTGGSVEIKSLSLQTRYEDDRNPKQMP